MYGVDCSRYQAGIYGGFNAKAYAAIHQCSFTIHQATYGYEVDGYFKRHYEYCESLGKLMGAYHYAHGLDPVKEARNFWAVVKQYSGRFIPFLDWEKRGNSSFGDKSWCLDFCTEYERLSGVFPGVYCSASVISQVAANHPKSCLWVAGYVDERDIFNAPSFPYATRPWTDYSIWQYTSSGNTLDRNVSPLTSAEWLELCGGWDVAATEHEIKEVIRKAICGK